MAVENDPDFNDYIDMDPAFGPISADEEPTPEELDALEDINAEVLKVIYGDNNDAVMGVIKNANELYQGVGLAAFQILLSTKTKFEAGGQKVPPAALFGEGAAIHTTVDELFQLAQAAGIPGSDTEEQYTAAMMEVMRLTGDHIEKSGDDDSVGEAQDLMIDIEAAAGNTGPVQLGQEDEDDVRGAIERSMQAQQAPAPEQALGGPPQQGQEEVPY